MSILNNIDSMILYEGWLDSFGVSTKFFSDLESDFKNAINTIKDSPEFGSISNEFNNNADAEVKSIFHSTTIFLEDYFKSVREEIFVGRTPELLREHVKSFFALFDRNPIVDKLVELSGSNPYILFAILSATIYTLGVLLVFGWKNIREKISKYNVSSSELKTAEKALTDAKTESDKKVAIKQIANLGAKHLIYQKFSK